MLVKDLIERKSRMIKSIWIGLIEKTNLRRASAIHATSALEAAEIQRFGWPLPPITTIANGVDEIERVDRYEVSTDVSEITAQQPLILFLGRITWKKGLDRLLNAFALMHHGKLAIVGPDDEKLAPHLVQRAQELHIGHRVRFLPRTVVGPDKEALYRAATIFVLPSYSESFGNTVLEAMQRGVAVVVTPEVGAAEIVRQSRGGVVVTGEPEPLARMMTRLITKSDLARQLGEAGAQHVIAHYTWTAIAARMETLYECLRV
jgi:glycosyltransferase involved in cell wall biosynthesis